MKQFSFLLAKLMSRLEAMSAPDPVKTGEDEETRTPGRKQEDNRA